LSAIALQLIFPSLHSLTTVFIPAKIKYAGKNETPGKAGIAVPGKAYTSPEQADLSIKYYAMVMNHQCLRRCPSTLSCCPLYCL